MSTILEALPYAPLIIRYPTLTPASHEEIALHSRRSRLLAFGEVHVNPHSVSLSRAILLEACQGPKPLALALEYFNVEQQHLLNDWLNGRIGWSELLQEYSKGPEGFPLEAYKPLLEAARDCGIPIVGVMPPRTKANQIARTGRPPTLPQEAPPVDPDFWHHYTEALTPLFPRRGPMARIPLENLLLAQSYKDTIAAHTVSQLIMSGYRVLLVMGWAHIETPGAVPHRIMWKTGITGEDVMVLGVRTCPYRPLEEDSMGAISHHYRLIVQKE
ncbi:MAG: ChaN family lipoprotein [Desulfurococcales archaeon]|nr:ChaN family lipoprotein [Desulfurococcales archaeon]